jgi:hypothetical protein
MNYKSKTKYKGYTIVVNQLDYVDNPRKEVANLGDLIMGQDDYWADVRIEDIEEMFDHLLPCEEDYRPWNVGELSWDYYEVDEMKAWRKIRKEYIFLPVYKYEHSGVIYRTTPFSCKWDSGIAGFIFASKEKVREEFGYVNISKKLRKEVERHLEEEVRVFSEAVGGSVYAYEILDPDGESVLDGDYDSPYFYGCDHDESGLIEAAESEINLILTNKK